MAPLSSVADVRTFAGKRLPPDPLLTDAQITPHLNSAARELAGWIGEYEDTTDDKKKATCKEAEACLTLANVLPTQNVFFTQGISSLQKEVGEVDFLFMSPDDLEKAVEGWRDRAERAVQSYISNADNAGSKGMRWYAI
jgi:hypothetical protein